MKNYTQFSGRSSLALVSQLSHSLRIWEAIEGKVKIHQKKAGYPPIEKLKEIWLTLLAGGAGVVEVNTRVRSEPGLQQAFGIQPCAEQSTVSRMLNQCTPENVVQLRAALGQLYRQQSQGFGHAYPKRYQVLDVDMTGLLAGRQGEGVTKGYFSDARNRRGRQLGRVLATLYNEVVVDRLYAGKRQLETCFQELVEAAEEVLELSEDRRKRTIIRVDGGGGRDADINWALKRGYGLICKVKSWQRAKRLLRGVTAWGPDPRHPTRELAWIDPPFAYAAPTRQLAMRETHADGRVYETVIVTNLPDAFFFAAQPVPTDPQAILSAILHCYDLRGGGIETANRNSKSGLGVNHRNKRSFAAQEMLVLLAQLAYNFLAWLQFHLAQTQPVFRAFGWLRMIRDVFQIPGLLSFNEQAQLVAIHFSRDHPFAKPFLLAAAALPDASHLSLYLRKI